jgi:aspartate aminotransferase
MVVVNGVSKAFAMTGYRIGYIAAPLWLAKACDKLQGQYTSGPCSVSQIASVAALNAPLTTVYDMVEQFEKRRDLVLARLAEIPGVKTSKPDGAFYVFPDISAFFGKSDGTLTINNADDMGLFILSNAFTGVVSGSAFGAPECIRISYAASEADLNKSLTRIKDALATLK